METRRATGASQLFFLTLSCFQSLSLFGVSPSPIINLSLFSFGLCASHRFYLTHVLYMIFIYHALTYILSLLLPSRSHAPSLSLSLSLSLCLCLSLCLSLSLCLCLCLSSSLSLSHSFSLTIYLSFTSFQPFTFSRTLSHPITF